MNRFKPEISPEDTLRSAYRFTLPERLIAQEPPQNRGESRLMIHNRRAETATASHFSQLARHLPPGVIVVNNSRVVPARLRGRRKSGGAVEILLTTPLPHIMPKPLGRGLFESTVSCLLKPSRSLHLGEKIFLDADFEALVANRGEHGQNSIRLTWSGNLSEKLFSKGFMPLPPYIKRPQRDDDALRYQTVYASPEKTGSIAAPTAGLHFTERMRNELAAMGFTWTEVTLYVGYGTFSPVRCSDIRDHAMHREYCEIPEESARLIAAAQKDGRPITAVGTTTARVLEGVAAKTGGIRPFQGWTDIFLYPGKPLRIVDHLITNFHLPESTLLMLTAAFAGREAILATYAKAIREKFQFFSYGDAMLIL